MKIDDIKKEDLIFEPIPESKGRYWRFKNLLGKTFGDLVVIGYVGRIKRRNNWFCECKCGNISASPSKTLVNGTCQSCGCKRVTVNRAKATKHNMKGAPTYNIWASMVQRTTDKKHKSFSDYGGRGIKVCDRWKDFSKFFEDIGERPSKNHSIERRDNSKGYSPKNCYWANKLTQANNKRNNILYTINGEVKTLAQWCGGSHTKKYKVAWKRIKQRGWCPECAISIKVNPNGANHTSSVTCPHAIRYN